MREERHRTAPQGERHIGYFDVHSEHAIDLAPVIEFQKDFKPTDIILGGDFLDCSIASHWNEKVFKHIGWFEISRLLKKAFKMGRDNIFRIRSAAPGARIWYIPGNHEWWLYLAAFAFPEIQAMPRIGERPIGFKTDIEEWGHGVLADMLREAMGTDDFKVRVLPYRRLLTLGKITYAHGDQFNNPAASKRAFPSRNMVFGHHHTHEVATLHDNGVAGAAFQHVAVPCLTTLSPGYLKTKSTMWLNGFWTARVLPNGLFDGGVVKVLGGKRIIT